MRKRETEGRGEGVGRAGGRKFKLMYYCSCYNLLFKIVVPFLG